MLRPDEVETVRPEVSKGSPGFDTSARTETSDFIGPDQ
jgi:hypothetical protein